MNEEGYKEKIAETDKKFLNLFSYILVILYNCK